MRPNSIINIFGSSVAGHFRPDDTRTFDSSMLEPQDICDGILRPVV